MDCCEVFVAVASAGSLAVASMLLCLPLAWWDPFDGLEDGRCDGLLGPTIVHMAALIPCLFAGASVCMCCAGVIAAKIQSSRFAALVSGCALFSLVFALLLALLVLCLQGPASCDQDSKAFTLSVSLMVLCPFGLVLVAGCLTATGPSWRSACCGALDPCCGPGGCRPVGEGEAKAPSAPMPRSQRLLRQACALGDARLVDLLLDLRGRRRDLAWRLYRAFSLGCCFCQCRISRWAKCGGRRDSSTRPRAALGFPYEDDDLMLPLHYVALGLLRLPGQDTHRRHRWEGRWSFRRDVLPHMTDARRARLLQLLVESGCITPHALLTVNATGMTPLHCAALSGSLKVLEVALAVLGGELGRDEAGGPPLPGRQRGLLAYDARGDTPAETALRHGRVAAARQLLGVGAPQPGGGRTWTGLLLKEQDTRVRDSLHSAFARAWQAGSPSSSPEHGDACQSEAVVLDQMQGVLEHLAAQVERLHGAIGAGVPREAAEALLRHHGFSLPLAAAAFAADPRKALNAAGLESVALPEAQPEEAVGGAADGTASMCIVCFERVPLGRLACQHVTCDDCLRGHIRARVEEGDVGGLTCPSPGCRLPLPDALVAELFEQRAREAEALLPKLRALKAQRFVDSHQASSWCPRPGCGRVVLTPAPDADAGGSSSSTPAPAPCERTVTCSCGTAFCSSCHFLGGHEPALCQHLRDWQAQVDRELRSQSRATRQWIEANTMSCPRCRANIQRNGGCNHMRCTACNTEFCYVCGKAWHLHRSQPGGLDHYNCRLAEVSGSGRAGDSQAQLFEECYQGFAANERDEPKERGLVALALRLGADFELGEAHGRAVSATADASLDARRALRWSYVLRHSLTSSEWRRGPGPWVGELEVLTERLESAAGTELLAVQLPDERDRDGLVACVGEGEPAQRHADEVLRRLDLRTPLAHAVAVERNADMIEQLAVATRLQTRRLLDETRARLAGKGGSGGGVAAVANALASLGGCSVM